MSAFYIVYRNGLLKQYFSEADIASIKATSKQPAFSSFLRKAVVFGSYDEANQMIADMKLENCYVINQFGQEQ